MMGNMMFYGMGGLFMMLFWAVVVIGGGFLIYRMLSNRNGTQEENDSALRILRERYAKGEISEEEYEKKRSDLTR